MSTDAQYTEITLEEARDRGLVAGEHTTEREDPDGVRRAYHQESQTYWGPVPLIIVSDDGDFMWIRVDARVEETVTPEDAARMPEAIALCELVGRDYRPEFMHIVTMVKTDPPAGAEEWDDWWDETDDARRAAIAAPGAVLAQFWKYEVLEPDD